MKYEMNPDRHAHPICRACHGALHAPFTNPERWHKRQAVIRELRGEQKGKSQTYWWEELSDEPINVNPGH